MAVKVDPRIRPIPKAFMKDPEIRRYFEEDQRWEHDITNRTGGGTDEIANAAVRETYPWDYSDSSASDNVALQSLFSSLIPEVKQWRAVTVTSDYTALDHDFINAKSGTTVKFPKYPSEGTAITIRNGDGTQIKLDGNGKTLNGESSGIISRKGTAIDFYYFIDTDEWFAR